MKLETVIIEKSKKFKKEYSKIISAIKRYDRIAIFRHLMPDYDALGTQFGLYNWIKDNFPNKEIKVLGDNHVTFTPRLFPETDNLNDSWFREPFLAIILDVSNESRIADPRWKKARYKVKIDHHPKVEEFGNVAVTDTTCAAASEVVVNMLLTIKGNYMLSENAAKYFYIGLVGDSGRFQYSSTSTHTFAVASHLLNSGINISDIYQNMYLKKIDDLKVTAYILNHFDVSKDGIAYYVLDAKIQNELNITTERGKENVNLFANIDGINAWCSVTEDPNPKDPCWRVSIRSKNKPINQVAAMFEGGGHAQASGARLNTIEDLPRLVEELGKLFR
ncbi:MAG: bifunctional oligoribonuclease/PAP phosphatase NrnA [Bacilli bacterium]|nr:bifunctional oligoribonuclease/PAP phosphatase NrnA [Bacilli bacterium]